jgi:hypothetical protein
MPRLPTYTAKQIKEMCQSLEISTETLNILVDLIEEEIDLYDDEDLIIITQASMILFNRALLNGALKFIKK